MIYKKILLQLTFEFAFRHSCSKGYLEIAKWLIDLSLQKNFTQINIHKFDESAFRYSCVRGHLEVAKWLVDLGMQKYFTPIDIHAAENRLFDGTMICCPEVTKWLNELDAKSSLNKIIVSTRITL